MANEINMTMALTLANGDLDSMTIPARTLAITQNTAAPVRVAGTQIIGTTEEALTVTDLTTPGVCYLRNRNATNYVEIGVVPDATFYPLIKLKAGEMAMFRITGSVTPYAKANTGACIVERVILDD
jgi:hypothetical protein